LQNTYLFIQILQTDFQDMSWMCNDAKWRELSKHLFDFATRTKLGNV